MQRALELGAILLVVALVVAAVFAAARYIPSPKISGTPNDLGQQLAIAAEHKDWRRARILLDSGADPTVTELDGKHEEMLHQPDWRDWLGMRVRWTSGHPIVLETALRQAMEQGDADAVQMLLDHHVPVSGEDVYHATQSGSRGVIQLMEDYGHVPLARRSIAQMPFAPGGQTAREESITGSAGAVPLQHLLWLSPHELLLVCKGPRRFTKLNLQWGTETELPELSQKWAGEQQFDPDMLALSPDAKWLLGFGGTSDHPTWLATEIGGNGRQEWDRLASPATNYTIERFPLIAWRDDTRWVEVNHVSGDKFVVRLRALGRPDVQELPLDRSAESYISDNRSALFTFIRPDEGLLRGQVGVHNYTRGIPDDYVVMMAGFAAGNDSWRTVNREFRLRKDDYPGWFSRCVPSPDGKRLAWLNYFTSSEAHDILLSDADGKNFRIVYERVTNPPNWTKLRAEAPWSRALEWTPDGDGLIFWRGDKGENGLAYLPIAPEE